jgi:hypothetical protein
MSPIAGANHIVATAYISCTAAAAGINVDRSYILLKLDAQQLQPVS